MDKAKLAEWILALVMDRTRAASLVGDLFEIEAMRGGKWFWLNVLRVWGATLCSQLTERPLIVAGLAVRGAAMHAALMLPAGFVYILLVVAWAFFQPGLTQDQISPLTYATFWLVVPFFVGRWVARRSEGKEIVVYLAMIIVEPFVFSALIGGAAIISGEPFAIRDLIAWPTWKELSGSLPFFIGARMVRWHQQIAACRA